MALPADFSNIFGSTATGGITPISDVNYAKGWEYVGSNPPTKNDFSYLQNMSDLKSQWLYANRLQRADPFGDIKADGSSAILAGLANLGFVGGNPSTGAGYSLNYFKIPVSTPSGISTKIVQFGLANSNGANDNTIGFPIPFPSQVRAVIVSPNYTNGSGVVFTASASASNAAITIRCNSVATIYWLAIGD